MYSIKGIKRILHKLPSFGIHFFKVNPKSIFSSQQQQQQRPPLLEDSRTPKQKKQDKDNNLSETNLAIALIAICVLHLLCQILRVFLAGLAVSLTGDLSSSGSSVSVASKVTAFGSTFTSGSRLAFLLPSLGG